MGINTLKESIKDYGRDVRLNLESVLSPEGAPGLTETQIWGIALASAYATKNAQVAGAVAEDASAKLGPEVIEAAKAAATIMAMNNVYYRFTHLAEDAEFAKMPARLRMNIIGKPGIAKIDFELMSLAVSAVEGCGKCITAHVAEARKAGVSNEGIQSAVRIAAVLNAAAQAVIIG